MSTAARCRPQAADRFRDAIVHLDEHLCKAPRPVGEPVALDLREAGLYLDGHIVSWSELSLYLRQAEKLAGRLGRTNGRGRVP